MIREGETRSDVAAMRDAFELAVMTTVAHPNMVQVIGWWLAACRRAGRAGRRLGVSVAHVG